MSLTHILPRQRGLSLVELLIGIAVGLFIVAAAAFMLSNQLHDGRRLVLETQVQQDLRAAADMVVRELRRAGYSGSAAEGAWYRGTPGVTASGYAAIESDNDSQVTFRYGKDADNTIDGNEEFGFRRSNGAIQFRLGTVGAEPNWQPLTDTGTLVVDTFTITQNVQEIQLDRFCARPCVSSSGTYCGPLQTVREYQIVIEGHAASDPTVRRSLRAAVRPRNDTVTGTCTAV